MEGLILESSKKYIPNVRCEKIGSRGMIRFEGRCYMEHTLEFFEPISNWLRSLLKQPTLRNLEVYFDLAYINTSATKCIYNMLFYIQEQQSAALTTRIVWKFGADDESIMEVFTDLKDEINLPFIHIDTNNE